jgi:LmbE family N-acetylglucosaminyl deacetylase
MKYIVITLLSSLCVLNSVASQKNKTNAEILEGFKKLKVLGSVLYVAAHPDDENTRLITSLVKDQKLRTAYISLTRGDGGQNLIGSELDEYLGVIRTNELMEARKIDGGMQYFTRANDFGYSKTAEETFTFWNKDSILADVIRAIRTFKPDVIINRFDHRTSGKTHGHHTAAAILGLEAALHSNSPLFMRSALQNTELHIVQRVLFNTSWFFYGGRDKFDAMDKSHLYAIETGNYYPALGYSNNEIAAQSRSMHKSQGFGISTSRGSLLEYFERIDGVKDIHHKGPFDGLNFSWSRINGGGNVERQIDTLIKYYDFDHPWKSIPQLQKIERYILDLKSEHWTQIKLEEVRELILDCSGIFTECSTNKFLITTSSSLVLHAECIVRNPVAVQLQSIKINSCKKDTTLQLPMETNKGFTWTTEVSIPEDIQSTCPFWLLNGRPSDMYRIDHTDDYCRPLNERQLKAIFNVTINTIPYTVVKDIIYKNDDRVLGEVKQNMDVIPAVTIVPDDPLVLINSKATTVKIKILANSDQQEGIIKIPGTESISITPAKIPFKIEKAGEEMEFQFTINSTKHTNTLIELPVYINEKKAYTLETIKYPHISWLNILLPAQVKLIDANVSSTKKRVAYLNGAGDYIDEALIKMGYPVNVITARDLKTISIKQFDVIVFGIRALNTEKELRNCKQDLNRFMNEGGKVIMQYNTTSDMATEDFAPAPLKLSRDRITDEKAEVQILKPEHPIFNTPNKIQKNDFDHWVQERGLYFPNHYDSSYVELLSMHDPNEKNLTSGILVKSHGKGYFVYTPLAWFRQLKAGVPGSYRLFSNIISF